jgi:Xaa-Pro aminopeptidase
VFTQGGPDRMVDVIELRTPAEIEQMRPAGRFVASVLEATSKAAAPGVNLLELDALAHDMIRAAGATSCYIDYHPSFGAEGRRPAEPRLRGIRRRLGRRLGDLDRRRHAS